jgi:uncharacterized protein (DUF983 family)
MYYSDEEKCAQDHEPGWAGSGESCSDCGTTEYFNSEIDGEPLCGSCIENRYPDGEY